RREKFLSVPVENFAADSNTESRDIKTLDRADPGFLSADAVPKTFDTFSDASDWPEAGNDYASSIHAVTVLCCASRYPFIQRKVLLAMLPIKKSPIIGSKIGASAGIRKLRSCKISTRTPSGVSSNVQTTCMPLVKAFR